MSDVEGYENLVIGNGTAGKYLAWALARAGQQTAIVERKYLGGSCPNIACLPSKNLIYSAKVASLARRGAEFGLEMDSLGINMEGVQRRKRLMVEEQHQLHVELNAASGAEVIMGEGRFIAPKTVEVTLGDGASRRICGARVFLNLGSRERMPDVPGLEAAQPMTHIEALDLDRLPEHLIVIGGGYAGLELSQAFRRFGSRVTLIEEGAQLAGHEDPDIGGALLDLFRDEGIEVLLESVIRQVDGRSGNKVKLKVCSKNTRAERAVEGTDLLVATGRKANTDGIGLEQTGVELNEHGYIKVNERLQTTAPDIWAMGDCAGSPMFTHVAVDDFHIVYNNLNGGNGATRNRLVPFCLFTDPELVRVGRNESEARRDGIEYRLVKMPMSEVLRTVTVSEPRGILKMLIGKSSDEILGFTAFGFEASELLAAVQTAMIGRLPYTLLRDAIFTHPTVAEGLNALLGRVEGRKTRASGRA
ncbi:MAG TPA: FAD-dependent oxidoreductase [Blastocatellia bacterium]|nr:FAD-dependent oxidoreductase [Blastocatellia bacterium]